MEHERTGNQDRGRAESEDDEAQEHRYTSDRWPALALRLAEFAIALCIMISLLQPLQIAIQHAGGSVEVFAKPEPGETQEHTRRPLEYETDWPIGDPISPAEGRMYETEELRRWIGSYSTSAPRTVY